MTITWTPSLQCKINLIKASQVSTKCPIRSILMNFVRKEYLEYLLPIFGFLPSLSRELLWKHSGGGVFSVSWLLGLKWHSSQHHWLSSGGNPVIHSSVKMRMTWIGDCRERETERWPNVDIWSSNVQLWSSIRPTKAVVHGVMSTHCSRGQFAVGEISVQKQIVIAAMESERCPYWLARPTVTIRAALLEL